ncbi:MAG: NAD-dependent epimerase/dehydratase family protein [Chloroflexi bacterium]|nr:NAD-dependent epimerase/dehydratase family protein [Chloroflexota bacterium]
MASGLRVAVSGVAGSIGSKLVERLAASDGVDSVVAFDARPVVVDHPKVMSFQQDIRQPLAGILRRHGVDAFVHLAFLLRAGRNRASARRVNVGGTAEVLRECRAAGVRRLLYLSSTTVYGARAGDPQPYTEESPVRPVRGFQYAEDKAATESLLQAFAAENPDTCVTVLRGCPVVGPRSENFATQALRRLVRVRIRGADPPMQFVHENDLLSALELCLLEPVPGVFNVTGEGTVAYSELVRVTGARCVTLPAPVLACIAQASWALRLQSDAPAAGLAMARWPWVASHEKLTRETGFRPRYTSREALQASTLAKDRGAPRD